MPQFKEISPENKRFGTTKSEDKGTEFIASIHTDQTGGLCMVDVVTLRSGKVLTITDECVVAWPSLSAWHTKSDFTGCPEGSFETGEHGDIGGIDFI